MASRGLRFAQGLLAVSLLYAAAASAGYVFEAYPRHRVESAWIVFGALCSIVAVSRWSRQVFDDRQPTHVRLLPWMVAAAFVLYWPSLGIGLLSDDYILLAAAERWEIVPAWEHFRPLSLGVWATMVAAGASPVALHALTISLHGCNAFLVSLLSRESSGGGETRRRGRLSVPGVPRCCRSRNVALWNSGRADGHAGAGIPDCRTA